MATAAVALAATHVDQLVATVADQPAVAIPVTLLQPVHQHVLLLPAVACQVCWVDLKVAETPAVTTVVVLAATPVALAAMAVDQLVPQTAAVRLHVLQTVLLQRVADAATMVVAVAPVVDC